MAAKTVSRVGKFVEAVPPRTLASLNRLSARTLKRLRSWIDALIEEKLRQQREKGIEGQQFFPTMLSGKVSMRLRYVKCGKDTCWCASAGKGHGPYWYAEWRTMDGKKHSRYVGKEWSTEKVKDLVG